MNRRYFLTLGTWLAGLGVALKAGMSAGQANADVLKDTAFEPGNRYYTTGGIFQVVDGNGAEANDATVIDLSPNARQAILLPGEPVADVSTLRGDTRPPSWFSEGQGLLTRDGFAYKVAAPDADDAHVVTEGGVKLYVAGPRVSVDAFGADPTGEADSTEAFNRALKFCAAKDVPGYSSGRYRITGTLGPGGRYTWDWGSTTLDFSGAPQGSLTEVLENPKGSSRPKPAGKYVLFDTKGCNAAVNTGSLSIIGSSPGDMKLASRTMIPANIVAITASEGSSADMTWGTLMLQGCDYGLWQGDQRGSALNILPYTRWQINYLKIQFCIHPLESGSSGNGFDDTFFSEVRLTRNGASGVLRGTDIGGGIAFINGLDPNEDTEDQTVATTAGDPNVRLSTENPDIRAGTVIVIRNAMLNKAGEHCDFVARVKQKSGNLLTLDRAPEVTHRGAEFLCNPPSIILATTQWRFQQTYLEEMHDIPMKLANRSAIYGLVKISNGSISSRYDCGIMLAESSLAKIVLHATSSNNRKVKAVVGVASVREQDRYNTNSADITVLGRYEEATVNSDPLKIIELQPDDIPVGYSKDASNEINPNLTLVAQFLDGTRQYQRHGAAKGKPAYSIGGNGMLELGAPIALERATFGGTMSDPARSRPVKARGGIGYLEQQVAGGRRYRIAVTLSSFEAGAPGIHWYGSGERISAEAIITRRGGRAILFADAPEGADHLRFFAGKSDAYTIDEFTVAEVLSV
jgi:hypothetical protein